MKNNRLKIAVIGITILLLGTGVIPGLTGDRIIEKKVEKVDSLEIENCGMGQKGRTRGDDENSPWSMTEVVSTESTWSVYEFNPSSSLAVDANGIVHVAWSDPTTLDNDIDEYSDWLDIFYKSKPRGGSWSDVELVSTESTWEAFCPSLAVDSFGTVHIAWSDWTEFPGSGWDCDIVYKSKPVGGSWSANPTQVVSTESNPDWDYGEGYFSLRPSLAIDNCGNVHIAWDDDSNLVGDNDENDYNSDIFYKSKSGGGGWPSQTKLISTESILPARRPSVAVDDTGIVHIAWHDTTNYDDSGYDFDIFFKNNTYSGSWSNPTEVVSIESTQDSKDPSLTIDNDRGVHVAWFDATPYGGSGNDYDIFYKKKNCNNNWIDNPTEVITTESISNSFECPSLAVDNTGTVHVAWQEGGCIFYKKKPSNSNWADNPPEFVSTESTLPVKHPSLDVDSYGIVHVSWLDKTNYMEYDYDADIFYKNKNDLLGEKNWTIMAYMDGDNDLEDELINDFLEVAQIGSTENINIIAQLDRHPDYSNEYGNWDDARRGIIMEDDVPDLSWGESIGEINMGDKDTLKDFITWSTQNYPAERYFLIINGPGNGWRALGADWTNNDILTPVEIGDAIQETLDENENFNVIDIVGFDMPYTASAEIAYEIQEYAMYMVGSEDIIAEDGWPYEGILEIITETPTLESEELVIRIIDEFRNYYDPLNKDCTVSALNLSRYEDFRGQLWSSIWSFVWNFDNGNDQTRHRLKLALATALEDTHTSDPSLVDIFWLACNAEHEFSDWGGLGFAELTERVTELVMDDYIRDTSGLPPFLSGLNIYLPLSHVWKSETSPYSSQTSFTDLTIAWDKLLDRAAPENSVLYRRNNPSAPADEWRGELVRGGWELYDTPPQVFEFMRTNPRTIPWIHGQVADTYSSNDLATLSHVDISLLYGGSPRQVYSDDHGYFMFLSNPIIGMDGTQAEPSVTLQDNGNGNQHYIRVIDYSNGNPNNVVSHTFSSVAITTRNDLFQQLDFRHLGGRDYDFSVIYHHTMQVLELARQVLVLELDHALPVDVRAYSTNPQTAYNPTDSTINIAGSGVGDGNRPDNREWHEFGHHIMTDSLIFGDNQLTMTQTNHGGYDNADSSDAWIEGWAEFTSLLLADCLNEPNPSWYRIGGTHIDFERNFAVDHHPPPVPPPPGRWFNEESALTGILWDLYDDNVDHTNMGTLRIDDNIELTIDEIWDVLNNAGINNIFDVHDAFSTFLGPMDSDGDGIDDLDEVFILHRCYNDVNIANNMYDPGEPVGLTSWMKSDGTWHTNRHNMPPIEGSYLLLTVIDADTLEPIDDYELFVKERNPPEFDYYDRDYTIIVSGESYIYFTMPPDHTEATITVKKDGYYVSDPIMIDVEYYWSHLGGEYLLEHTFYLEPKSPQFGDDCQRRDPDDVWPLPQQKTPEGEDASDTVSPDDIRPIPPSKTPPENGIPGFIVFPDNFWPIPRSKPEIPQEGDLSG